MPKSISKVQRVRDYLSQNLAARNQDVAAALMKFGVTSADVANAKTAMKKSKKAKRRTSKSASKSKQTQRKPSSGNATASVDAKFNSTCWRQVSSLFAKRAA